MRRHKPSTHPTIMPINALRGAFGARREIVVRELITRRLKSWLKLSRCCRSYSSWRGMGNRSFHPGLRQESVPTNMQRAHEWVHTLKPQVLPTQILPAQTIEQSKHSVKIRTTCSCRFSLSHPVDPACREDRSDYSLGLILIPDWYISISSLVQTRIDALINDWLGQVEIYHIFVIFVENLSTTEEN